MMKIRYMLMTMTLFLSYAAIAQEVSLYDQFESELKLKNESVITIECNFVQTREMSILQNIIRRDGKFFFKKPGNMLLSFNDGDYIKMTEEWFEMKTGGSITATKVLSNPMLRNLSAILSACVVGNFEQMARGFSVNLESKPEEWIVVMTPQRGRAASKISQIILHFDRKTMSLDSMKMVEKFGDYTMYTFSGKKFNVDIDGQIFSIVG